jgi:hypothetical protein
MSERLPQLFTARFFARSVLSSGLVVPVDVAYRPPTIPLGYALKERVEALVPHPEHLGEWALLSRGLWHKLERIGVEAIAAELFAISERHAGKPPLALSCWENVTPKRGHQCHRVVFAAWWQEHTGQKIHELTDEGEAIAWDQLHPQVMPKRPAASQPVLLAEAISPWPWTYKEFERFVEGVKWTFAKTMPQNPHEYTLSTNTSRDNFELAVLFIREEGYQHTYGRWEYTQLEAGEYFYWTMGAELSCTVVINRKLRDPEAQARLRKRLLAGKQEGSAIGAEQLR